MVLKINLLVNVIKEKIAFAENALVIVLLALVLRVITVSLV